MAAAGFPALGCSSATALVPPGFEDRSSLTGFSAAASELAHCSIVQPAHDREPALHTGTHTHTHRIHAMFAYATYISLVHPARRGVSFHYPRSGTIAARALPTKGLPTKALPDQGAYCTQGLTQGQPYQGSKAKAPPTKRPSSLRAYPIRSLTH